MLFERLEYFIRHRVHIREVKTQDQVPSLLGCRVIENDNFANDILARKGQGDYNILISEDSFFQRFFARIKAGTIGDRAIKRAFITGISPIVRKSVGFGTDMSDDA